AGAADAAGAAWAGSGVDGAGGGVWADAGTQDRVKPRTAQQGRCRIRMNFLLVRKKERSRLTERVGMPSPSNGSTKGADCSDPRRLRRDEKNGRWQSTEDRHRPTKTSIAGW